MRNIKLVTLILFFLLAPVTTSAWNDFPSRNQQMPYTVEAIVTVPQNENVHAAAGDQIQGFWHNGIFIRTDQFNNGISNEPSIWGGVYANRYYGNSYNTNTVYYPSNSNNNSYCGFGYRYSAHGSYCVKILVPVNAYLLPNGESWACRAGFAISGNGKDCVPSGQYYNTSSYGANYQNNYSPYSYNPNPYAGSAYYNNSQYNPDSSVYQYRYNDYPCQGDKVRNRRGFCLKDHAW